MSELSLLQHEYERLSAILRQLNRLIIEASDNPQAFRVSDADRDQLICQLEYLKECAAAPAGRVGSENWFAEALEYSSPDTRSNFPTDVERVVQKLKDRNARLTPLDLETAGHMAAALDTASALLFKRIQPR